MAKIDELERILAVVGPGDVSFEESQDGYASAIRGAGTAPPPHSGPGAGAGAAPAAAPAGPSAGPVQRSASGQSADGSRRASSEAAKPDSKGGSGGGGGAVSGAGAGAAVEHENAEARARVAAGRSFRSWLPDGAEAAEQAGPAGTHATSG
jgi:hypothetical protein